jgi:hypothetical protein
MVKFVKDEVVKHWIKSPREKELKHSTLIALLHTYLCIGWSDAP